VKGLLPLLLVALVTTGCIQLHYFRVSHFEPTPDPVLKQLEGSHAELQVCLDALGAPLLVGELPDGIAVAYGWQDRGNWGLDIGYTFERFFNVRFNYQDTQDSLRGVLLLFGSDLHLKAIRRGLLGDLTRQFHRRPASPEE
jgi:hypothetical protein